MTIFSKHHHDWLATFQSQLIKEAKSSFEDDEVKAFINATYTLAEMLKADNPKFDPERFITAVMGEDKSQ